MEYIYGSDIDDVLVGTAEFDDIVGYGGSDQLYGGDGDDDLDGGDGNDQLFGGAGNDYLLDWRGSDFLYGGDGDDMLSAYGQIYGVADADVLDGDRTVLFVDTNRDHVVGPEDLRVEFDGAPVLTVDSFVAGTFATGGTDGNDQLVGTNGNDTLEGLGGDDTLDGLDGDDTLFGGGGDDRLDGGSGMDTAILRGNFADYAISYDSVSHQYTLVDQAPERDGTDIVHGVENFAFADGMKNFGQLVPHAGDGLTLVGTAYSDRSEERRVGKGLRGLGGNDYLNGIDDDDVLDGGDGEETLFGCGGADR